MPTQLNQLTPEQEAILYGPSEELTQETELVPYTPEQQEVLDKEQANPLDYRLRNLSYSASLKLHACPRKFQLDRLNSKGEDEDLTGMRAVTFAFGHAVGDGIQALVKGTPLDEVLFDTFVKWPVDLFVTDTVKKKDLYYAMAAIVAFESTYTAQSSDLSEYDLYYYTDSEGIEHPALELAFVIELPDGFLYRGKADVVLAHKETRELLVLEVKTDGSREVNPAKYKNSAQALGYSVVLDAIAPNYSSYTVMYVVYATIGMGFQYFDFLKTRYMRASWITQIVLDVEAIKMYEQVDSYPMYGESCFDWNRTCAYYNLCTLSTENLIKPLTEKGLLNLVEKNKEYYIRLTLADLIDSQLDSVAQ
jgi:hypothetical protein